MEDLFPTNRDWWINKLRRNIERDRLVTANLRADGWRVVRVWESDVLREPAKAADLVEASLLDR
jgi:DNA mismatch endonuclease (patch repair protein)